MRHFQLPSANPLFQQESLQLLTDMEMGYEPALMPELQDYVAAQAPFMVKEASEYRSSAANWPALLAAGQRAFVEIWQQCQANQEKLPIFIKTEVGEAIRAVAAQQLAGHTTPENLKKWAGDAGESEANATVFAEYHRARSDDYEKDMAESLAELQSQVPANAEAAADMQEDLDEVSKDTFQIPATVLSWAWEYIGKYKVALAKGHGPEWADTYARDLGLGGTEKAAEREAYEQLWLKYPNPKTVNPAPVLEADTYPNEGLVNKAVYQEAYAVRLDRGADYADAYAKAMGLSEFDSADAYAEAYVEMLRAGKSKLFADYYASEVSDDTDPKYAVLEAELYEQALADGMNKGWAREYAERLSANLIEYAETDEDREQYTQEAAEYIALKQRKAQEAREARERHAD